MTNKYFKKPEKKKKKNPTEAEALRQNLVKRKAKIGKENWDLKKKIGLGKRRKEREKEKGRVVGVGGNGR